MRTVNVFECNKTVPCRATASELDIAISSSVALQLFTGRVVTDVMRRTDGRTDAVCVCVCVGNLCVLSTVSRLQTPPPPPSLASYQSLAICLCLCVCVSASSAVAAVVNETRQCATRSLQYVCVNLTDRCQPATLTFTLILILILILLRLLLLLQYDRPAG